MSKMINDMLFLAQAESGEMVPEKLQISLLNETLSLFDYFDAWAEEKGVSLTITGQDVAIMGNRLMIRRVISNLLSNAIRYAADQSMVLVELASDKECISMRVINTGNEIIPADQLERIFERFYRVDPSRQNAEEGSGIGLAIAKLIVQAHKGKIFATSNKQRTVFTVQFTV